MATNPPSCVSIQFLEQLLKFLANFTLLKFVKSQRSYGFLITKELIFGFQILDLKDHFSASLNQIIYFFQQTYSVYITTEIPLSTTSYNIQRLKIYHKILLEKSNVGYQARQPCGHLFTIFTSTINDYNQYYREKIAYLL